MLHFPRSPGRGASQLRPDHAFHVVCAVVTVVALLGQRPVGATTVALVSTALIVVHELGHMVAARLAGIQIRLRKTVITPFYGRSSIARGRDTWSYVAMALAGPVAGAVAAGVGLLVSARLDPSLAHWVRLGCTAALVDNLIVNLLPVSNLLDGAKALACTRRMLRRRMAGHESAAPWANWPETDNPALGDSAGQVSVPQATHTADSIAA